jgi:aminopeptidase N
MSMLILFCGCKLISYGQTGADNEGAPGVSYALALHRSAVLRDIRYELSFSIPGGIQRAVSGAETISFKLLHSGGPLLLDFKAPASALRWVRVNGHEVAPTLQNEHLVLPAGLLREGADSVSMGFVAGNAALNRNNEYLYTLIVPDRARTIFPCFDQPDLKAVFTLSLTVPAGWKAMANGKMLDSTELGDSCRFRFLPSDRISTYLFSFVAGKWSSASRVVDGRLMRFLYRETDSTKLRLSMDPIFRIEGQALHFMEDYTGIAYPFQKFDFVAVPDFQFGGMEHAGAILYKAGSLFLDSGATRDQLLGRSKLLSHETAHMWFGDMVTMTWFNDVWMKEVFANFMADKLSSVTFPDGKYDLKFLTAHYPAAYNVDRTAGTHPIRQQLDNLQEAGSLYGNIIYDKAPVVMRQLEWVIGPEGFRKGLQDYLRRYAGRNAGWPDLIRSLQPYTKTDLSAWSAVWVDGAGRPAISFALRMNGDKIAELSIRQMGEDQARGEGGARPPEGSRGSNGSLRLWPQVFGIALVYPSRVDTFTVNMNAAIVRIPGATGKALPQCVILNADGHGYGLFEVDGRSVKWFLLDSAAGPMMRSAAYINLYENMLAGQTIKPRQLLAFDRQELFREPEELNLNILLDQVNSIFWRFLPPAVRDSLAPGLEEDCWQAMLRAPSDNEKKLLFRTFSNIVMSREGTDKLFYIWKDRRPPAGVQLSEDDYTSLAAALALRAYPDYRGILDEQLGRIKNGDRRERWLWLQPALSNDVEVRDKFFAGLKDSSNRRKEAWVVSALGYLHHPLRAATSEKYLPATLDWLAAIQRTGDVFFPQSWLGASFGYYQTVSAAAVVKEFLEAHPRYNPRLKAKILQATDNLFRAEKLLK